MNFNFITNADIYWNVISYIISFIMFSIPFVLCFIWTKKQPNNPKYDFHKW